jgi:uncharacterized protein YhhL (DUF1145 family)
MRKFLIWIVWFLLVVLWNFYYPLALPYEDCIVTVALAILIKNLELIVYGKKKIS